MSFWASLKGDDDESDDNDYQKSLNQKSKNDNQNYSSEFSKILKENPTNRFFYGLEYLEIFRISAPEGHGQKNNFNNFNNYNYKNNTEPNGKFRDSTSSMFYFCSLCQKAFKRSVCISHFSDYEHLFIYTKINYPTEYDRLIDEYERLDCPPGKLVKAIEALLTTIRDRTFAPEMNTERLINSKQDFDYYIHDFLEENPRFNLSDLKIDINWLRDKNRSDEEISFSVMRQQSIFESIKKSPKYPSHFLQNLQCFDTNDESNDSSNNNIRNHTDKRILESDSYTDTRNAKRPFIERSDSLNGNEMESESQNLDDLEDQEYIKIKTFEDLKQKINAILNDEDSIDRQFIDSFMDNFDDLLDLYENEAFRKISDKVAHFINQQSILDNIKTENIDDY